MHADSAFLRLGSRSAFSYSHTSSVLDAASVHDAASIRPWSDATSVRYCQCLRLMIFRRHQRPLGHALGTGGGPGRLATLNSPCQEGLRQGVGRSTTRGSRRMDRQLSCLHRTTHIRGPGKREALLYPRHHCSANLKFLHPPPPASYRIWRQLKFGGG